MRWKPAVWALLERISLETGESEPDIVERAIRDLEQRRRLQVTASGFTSIKGRYETGWADEAGDLLFQASARIKGVMAKLRGRGDAEAVAAAIVNAACGAYMDSFERHLLSALRGEDGKASGNGRKNGTAVKSERNRNGRGKALK